MEIISTNRDFFISYNKADRVWAEWVAWELEEEGYTTILQEWDFRPGQNFVIRMNQTARQAERTVAILSPDYLGADYTQPEWAVAFAQDPTGENGLLIPIRVRECDFKGLLPQIIYIDLVGSDEQSAKHSLLTGVLRGRAKPAKKPIFPGTVPRSVAQRPNFPGGKVNWLPRVLLVVSIVIGTAFLVFLLFLLISVHKWSTLFLTIIRSHQNWERGFTRSQTKNCIGFLRCHRVAIRTGKSESWNSCG